MTTPTPPTTPSASRLLAHLPAIYRDEPFLGRYLWAFEQLFIGLEQRVESLPKVFDPFEADEAFLPWLSSWVAFTLRASLNPVQQRDFLANIVSLYRRRGTKENLAKLLAIFTHSKDHIDIEEDPVQPHLFRVTMRLPADSGDETLRQSAIAHALIQMEKPAHTRCELNLQYPTMQIGVTSTIGVDTLLGTDPRVTATAVKPLR